MYVSTILKSKGATVHTIEPGATCGAAAKLLAEKRIGALVVSHDDRTVDGILSERDIVRASAVHGCDVFDQPVQTHMSAKVVTCAPDDTVERLMEIMTESRIRHVPVMVDSTLAGMISIGDVVKYRLEELQFEAEQMRELIVGG